MSEPTEPRRMTPTERNHEALMALINRPARQPSESVTVSRNAKGDKQYEVAATTQDGETLEEAVARAKAIVADLDAEYELSRTQTYERNNEPPARVRGATK